MVELGSNGATDINPEIKTRSREGKVANDGVVELGCHRVAPVENLRPRMAGAQTVGPMPNRERTEGLECGRFSERRQLTRPGVRPVLGTRHRRVELWKVKERQVIGGEACMSEIPRFQRHVSLLRRGTPDDPCNDRLTIYKGGEKDDSREGSVGPDMMDPILLGGSDDYLDLVNANNNALGDPLLLCEVDRNLGRDCAIIQQGCET